jgi:hypothetical protein
MFTDMADLGRNPARIIPARREFTDRSPTMGGVTLMVKAVAAADLWRFRTGQGHEPVAGCAAGTAPAVPVP